MLSPVNPIEIYQCLEDGLISINCEEPNEYRHARSFLMRQVIHMSNLSFVMLLASAAGKPIDMDSIKTDFRGRIYCTITV